MHQYVAKFLTVGLSVNLLALVGYWVLLRMGIMPELAVCTTFVPAIALAHHLNRNWAFQSDVAYLPSLFRYCGVNVGMVGLQLAILFVSHRIVGLDPFWSYALAVVLSTAASFIAVSLVVFRGRLGVRSER